jgi:hypothetical protein
MQEIQEEVSRTAHVDGDRVGGSVAAGLRQAAASHPAKRQACDAAEAKRRGKKRAKMLAMTEVLSSDEDSGSDSGTDTGPGAAKLAQVVDGDTETATLLPAAEAGANDTRQRAVATAPVAVVQAVGGSHAPVEQNGNDSMSGRAQADEPGKG